MPKAIRLSEESAGAIYFTHTSKQARSMTEKCGASLSKKFFRIPPEDVPVRIRQRVVRIQVA